MFQKGHKDFRAGKKAAKERARQKRGYTNGQTKDMEPPSSYEKGFLAKMDKRTSVTTMLRDAYDEIIRDVGGYDNISHVKRCLCERFVFIEYALRNYERAIVTANKEDTNLLLSRWVQALNSITGLGRLIGLERSNLTVESLSKYIKDKKKGKNRKRKRERVGVENE